MRYNQARRKASVNITVLFPISLIEAMQAQITSQNRHSLEAPINQSEFIRRAVERDLKHAARSRSKRKPDSRVNDTPTDNGNQLNTVPGEMLNA